jgi:PAS domain-containing protein
VVPGCKSVHVGVSARPVAASDVAISEGAPAAIAIVSEGGAIEHATRAFVDRLDVHDGSLTPCPDEVERVIASRAHHLTLKLDGAEADVVAVVDGDGRRTAAITIPTAHDEAEGEPASPLFAEPVDESPAIVWLKDLDGRYLRVNQRYVDQIGGDADQICGRTDAELTAAGSIEGLRLEEKDANWQEPLELEYRVGAFEERPGFAVLRFAIRDREGQPTATCSIAAPDAEAAVARSECERLMQIERLGRLDAFAIRQELFDEWGLRLADGSSGPPLAEDDRVAAALGERDEALATLGQVEDALKSEREKWDGLRAESEQAGQRAQELDGAVAAERARSEELERSLARADSRVTELESELTSVRAELEEHLVSSDRVTAVLVERDQALATAARLDDELTKEREQQGSLRSESERAAERLQELDDAVAAERERAGELEQSLAGAESRTKELEAELTTVRAEMEQDRLTAEAKSTAAAVPDKEGLRWGMHAQHALSAALVGVTEWQAVLKNTVAVLGKEGGWEATIAWCPERPGGVMTCSAMWMRGAGNLARFETRTWQHRPDASKAEYGRARKRMAATCLLELESAEDGLLRAAADVGMGSALLVPISDGGETIAMLELFASTDAPPNAELMESLDAIALQLGGIAQLIKHSEVPRWRMGRM